LMGAGQYSSNPTVTKLWKEWEREADVLLIREELSPAGAPLFKMMRVEFDVRARPWALFAGGLRICFKS